MGTDWRSQEPARVTVAGGPRGPIGYGRGPRALYRAILVKVITSSGVVSYATVAVSFHRCSSWFSGKLLTCPYMCNDRCSAFSIISTFST